MQSQSNCHLHLKQARTQLFPPGMKACHTGARERGNRKLYFEASTVRQISILNTVYSLFSHEQRGHFATKKPPMFVQFLLHSSILSKQQPSFPFSPPPRSERRDGLSHMIRYFGTLHSSQWYGQYGPHTFYFSALVGGKWESKARTGRTIVKKVTVVSI